MKLRFAWIISLLLFFLLGTEMAFAGFGITPPYVRNNSLSRDSTYEQQIILTRSDPVEDLKAKITVNVPGADDWFEIDKGMEFDMPKGEMQVPMTVRVKVPKRAKLGDYKGNIRVVIESGNPTPGTVGISLGAQIDVLLTVGDQKIYSFKVQRQYFGETVEGHKFLGIFFPGKISLHMQVENTGNTAFGPTKVALDIRDAQGKLLEHTENVNRIRRVKPFEIGEVTAEMPTRLPPGAYRATFSIYNNNEIVKTGELNLSVLPYGTLPYQGFYFYGLRRYEQILIVAVVLAILGLLGGIVLLFRRRRHRHRIPPPPRYVG